MPVRGLKPLPTPKGQLITPKSISAFNGGINNTVPEQQTRPNEACDGRNMFFDVQGGAQNRFGSVKEGNFLGSTTGILQAITHYDSTGAEDDLAVYDTGLYRESSSTWSAVAGVTFTTNLRAESAYFEYLDKTYIVNGTDNVVKYTTGGTADQSDGSFKKGTGIASFANRLLVWGVSGQKNYLWVSDLAADTFSANAYVRLSGPIQRCIALDNQRLMVLTDRKVYYIPGFTSTPNAVGPEAVFELAAATGSTSFGCIAPRSVVRVGKAIYWLGVDSQNTAEVYFSDGQTVRPIGGQKIKAWLSNLNAANLSTACAVKDGRFYRLAVPPSGSSVNTREYLYDTVLSNPYALDVATDQQVLSMLVWQSEFVPGFPINCYATRKVGGQEIIYAGHQSLGQVYKLGTGHYDELLDQTSLDSRNAAEVITGSTTVRAAQSFKLSASAGDMRYLTGGAVLLAQNGAGTQANLTVRIETDSSGIPSGTLADSNLTATVTAFSGASYVWKTFTFATPAKLTGSTTYWLVIQHTTEGSGSSSYNWGSNSSGTYASGNVTNYSSGSWTAAAAHDAIFVLSIEEYIESYVTQTSAYGYPVYRKKIPIVEVEGQSITGIVAYLGVGTNGKNSNFSYTDLQLNGKTAVWSSSSSDTTTGHLVWATGSDDLTPNRQWASPSAGYSLTVFPDSYLDPARFVTTQFYFKGIGDFRINSYTPIIELIPTNL